MKHWLKTIAEKLRRIEAATMTHVGIRISFWSLVKELFTKINVPLKLQEFYEHLRLGRLKIQWEAKHSLWGHAWFKFKSTTKPLNTWICSISSRNKNIICSHTKITADLPSPSFTQHSSQALPPVGYLCSTQDKPYFRHYIGSLGLSVRNTGAQKLGHVTGSESSLIWGYQK